MTHPMITPYFPPPPTYLQNKQTQRSPSIDTSLPSSIRRSRKFLLPAILLLSFVTTILSTIYAYCIASPHTRLTAADYANDPHAELNDSMFRRDATSGTTIRSPTPTLISYTLTTPLATLLIIVAEIAQHILRPKSNYSRLALLLSLVSALCVSFGWIATSIIWVHCEISPLQHTPGAQNMCPASVRGHFMWGIHELSWAKAALGFLIGICFLFHALFVFKSFRNTRQLKSCRRGSAGLGLKHGEGQLLEREMEEGLRVQRDLRKGLKKHGQKVRIIG